MRASLIRRGILFFWALWFTVVLASNLADGGRLIGILPESWPFTSGNYRLIHKYAGIYESPEWLADILFLGVLLWESAIMILFWRAAFAFRGDGETGLEEVHAAFFAGIGFWAALLVADEIFLTFTLDAIEVGHMVILGTQMLSLLAWHPDALPARRTAPPRQLDFGREMQGARLGRWVGSVYGTSGRFARNGQFSFQTFGGFRWN